MKIRQTLLVRGLAFMALLCTLALNLELTHSHADHDDVVHCAACTSSASGDVLLSAAVALQVPTIISARIASTADAVVVSLPFRLVVIRGPPQVS
ncbi:hypothetical protein [Candidatus Marimicrobium litorale]|uniref:Uncharacterized protein n=1 Tax=Candidatus Marimicrobium litorale TaxID=2518991 RepID=A0ABT3T747_9GAMM|nr:hypothetical protein [Candidatus Marimicrobium litorale]MCX2978096.1 hypothetical protein [Candidatus Marimicrobium litorale]